VRGDLESLFLLAFSEEEFLAALAMASSEAFFNKLLVALPVTKNQLPVRVAHSTGRCNTI
jgi:hypothetical protein